MGGGKVMSEITMRERCHGMHHLWFYDVLPDKNDIPSRPRIKSQTAIASHSLKGNALPGAGGINQKDTKPQNKHTQKGNTTKKNTPPNLTHSVKDDSWRRQGEYVGTERRERLDARANS